jgi:glycopeptide antibiotics resistance protein
MLFVKSPKQADTITFCYVVLLFALAVLPINGKDSASINNTYVLPELRLDYLLHSFLLVPWMPIRVFYAETNRLKELLWLAIGVILAITTEVIQYFLTYRTYNVIDLAANLLGVFIGAALWQIIQPIYKK